MEGDSAALQLIGRWIYKLYDNGEVLGMYIHLLLAALFPIVIGAHASLRRPPSASKPDKKTAGGESDDEDSDLDVEASVEGLTPSDAIMFPVLAGITLAFLYFLIKWLKDPALLNKILGYYFSAIGVVGVGKLAGDALNVGTTFIFPSVWSAKGQTYHVDPILSMQFSGSSSVVGRTPLHRKFEDKSTPLPGALSTLSLSEKWSARLWATRALFLENWIFTGYINGLLKMTAKVRLNDAIGLLIGLAAITLYNVNGKAWWLTNLMGFGFCYGTLQFLSPTTFWTGTLVLCGLFVYDITMVFYTPLMVTVATSLDVPIKLIFPGPKRGSMLGLGDVVLPGIMMALALRYDLYLHYLRMPKPKPAPVASHSLLPNTPSTTTTLNDTKILKPAYVSATGNWGERFWTMRTNRPEKVSGGTFRKTYFYASIVGYLLGMIVTLVVLNVFNHAQPALLYLVPGVLGALWGTALVRGEVKEMWNYTEDGSLEEEEEKEKKESTDVKGKSGDVPVSNNGGSTDTLAMANTQDQKAKQLDKKDEHAHHVFLFSLSTPKKGMRKAKRSD